MAKSEVLSIVSNEGDCSRREVNTGLVDLVKMDGVDCTGKSQGNKKDLLNHFNYTRYVSLS